ncbi:histidine phosphatase family protein [Staphylococcus simulans]|uniref:histidine phosphatase family protein n=1 Tax=Staphylococcus simulans TaxID=1286 RepID=UPI000D02A24D|nr:histidine phosphatase family protein [Staphylococcus simulans]
MKKTLYLIRHGQTLFNKKHQIQGASDSPLTELGKQQAAKAKLYFDQLNLTDYALFSSTQERASDTLEILFPDEPYTRLKGIKEWNYGLFEGESELLNPPHPNGVVDLGDFFAAYGGETVEEVQTRTVKTLHQVVKETPHQNVVAASHGDILFLFAHHCLPVEAVKQIKITNCCILKFEYEDETFTFVEAIHPA